MARNQNNKKNNLVREDISAKDIERAHKVIFDAYLHQMVREWLLPHKKVSASNKELCIGYIDKTIVKLARELREIVWYTPDYDEPVNKEALKGKMH